MTRAEIARRSLLRQRQYDELFDLAPSDWQDRDFKNIPFTNGDACQLVEWVLHHKTKIMRILSRKEP